ncbi:MAG TPA: AgmX/PglI C-terminal domain-containing protein [Burkholderiaceae bacterium]|nr:AgmX/PglI C-terminal domain-containing protein [Burkholderiaceae bacterium]
MVSAAMRLHAPVLAWSVSAEDEARFKRILRTVLLICLAIALAMPWLTVRQPDRSTVEPLPPRLAKLLLEREPPAPVLPKPVKPVNTEPLASSKPVASQKIEPKAQVVEARRPEANKPPGEHLENARAKASGVGLLAMKNELAELHAAPAAVQLSKDVRPGPGVGTGVGPGVGAGQGPGVPTRSLITSNVTGGSGGINTAAYSRDTGGGGLAGRSTTLVEGVAGGRGGGGPGGTAHGAGGSGGGPGAGPGGTLQKGGSGKASRSIEEIKLVFERNKGAIYAIYNRALREEPSLQGKVVLELRIAPAGQVTDLRIVSSELRSTDLERKLLARIRQFDFGAKDVDAITVTWPVDFLPS